MLGVSANFYSIAGVSRRVWVLWDSWGVLGDCLGCQGAAVSQGGIAGCSSGVLWLLWVLGMLWVLGVLVIWDFCRCWGYCGCCVCWGCCRCWGWCLCVYDRPALLPTAPEVVKGDPVGSAADVWGVGVLTYIM